jgi:hypothetical protein
LRRLVQSRRQGEPPERRTMSARAGEWKLGGARRAPNLVRVCLAALVPFGFCLPAQAADRLDRVKHQLDYQMQK